MLVMVWNSDYKELLQRVTIRALIVDFLTISAGLAMAATTESMSAPLIITEVPDAKSNTGSVHVFDIVALILEDEQLSYGRGADQEAASRFVDSLDRHAERLRGYFKHWDPSGALHEVYEEVVYLVTALYGFSGWRGGEPFKANFFMSVFGILYHILHSTFLHTCSKICPQGSSRQLCPIPAINLGSSG